MRKHIYGKLGLATVLAATLLTGCGQSSSHATKQTLTWMENSALPTMDISKAVDVVSAETLNNTGEGLLRMGTHNSLHPGVAKTYTKSADGKTYTFNLRHSKWSNGDDVTAQDFVYSWRRTVAPKTASEYAYLFADIKNATAITAKKKAVSTLGVKAVGKYRLVVTLNHPVAYFADLVAGSTFFPQNKRVVTKYGKDYAANAQNNVYNGPFKLTYWTGTSDNWTLTKNTSYWDKQRVKLQYVKLNAVKDPQTALSEYQSGKLDAIYLSGQQPKNYKNSKEYVNRTSARTTYVELNQRKDPLMKNKKARQALSLAINRQQFTQKVMDDGSTAAQGIVTTGLAKNKGTDFTTAATSKANNEHNLAKAKKLWKSALKETGKKAYTMTLTADDTVAGKNATEFIQSQWAKLPGLKVTNANVPYKTTLTRAASGDFNAIIMSWSADFPDPIAFLQLFTTNNSYNEGRWSNRQYDRLIAAATGKDANDIQKRWRDMIKAQRILVNDQGIIPVYQQGKPQLVKTNVKGVVYFSVGANFDFSHAYIAN